MAEHAETKKGKDDNACVILTLGLLSSYKLHVPMHAVLLLSYFYFPWSFNFLSSPLLLSTQCDQRGFCSDDVKVVIIMDVVNRASENTEEAGACSANGIRTSPS